MGKKKGSSAFPVARIKKMMQADDDVGKIATATPILVGKALECMIEDVLGAAAAVAVARRAKTVQPAHLREAVESADKYDFLRPTLSRAPLLEDKPAKAPTTPRNRTKPEPAGVLPEADTGKVKAPRSPSKRGAKRPRSTSDEIDSARDPVPGGSFPALQPPSSMVHGPGPMSIPGAEGPPGSEALTSALPGGFSLSGAPQGFSTSAVGGDDEDDEDYDDEGTGDNELARNPPIASTSAGFTGTAGTAAIGGNEMDLERQPPGSDRAAEAVMPAYSGSGQSKDEMTAGPAAVSPRVDEPISFAPMPPIKDLIPVPVNSQGLDVGMNVDGGDGAPRPNVQGGSDPSSVVQGVGGDGNAGHNSSGQGGASEEFFTLPTIPLEPQKATPAPEVASGERERVSVMSLLS